MIREATGVRAPADSFSELAERLVDTGIPWNTPAPTLAIPWATDSWSTSIRYRCRVANERASPAVCEKPIRSNAAAAIPITERLSRTRSRPGRSGAGRPRGTSPTSATPWAPRSKRADASSPPTTSTSAPGIAGARKRTSRITASATAPTSRVTQWISPSPRTHDPNSRQTLSPSPEVPVSFGSSPTVTSMAAPARNPITTAFERNWAIQPSLKTASSRNRIPVSSVIAATSCAAWSPPTPVASTAPPATAARDELGPVEICREVQKIP